jgi:hypothetical protein
VSDNQLSVEVSDQGGDPYWVLNGLRVAPIAAAATGPGGVTFSRSGPNLDADGLSVDTITVNGPAGSLVTVTASVGAIISSDASTAYQGFQVLADGSFQLRHPAAPGVLDLAGMAVDGSATGESLAAATYTLPAVRRFDFDGPGNYTASGYIGVRGGVTYTPAQGYGWQAAAPEFERSTADALRRDGHYGTAGSPGTFKVVVAQNQPYAVTVIVGDASYPRDQIRITVEGAGAYTIASLAAGQYYSHVATGVSSDDAVLTITVEDVGGDPYWVANGVEVAAQ